MVTLAHRRRAVVHTVVLGILAAGVLGMVVWRIANRPGMPPNSTTTPTGSARHSPDRTPPSDETGLFKDVTSEVGLDFVHDAGDRGRLYFPEPLGSGGAFLDYDNDGDLDVYLVQGGPIDPGGKIVRNRLYRNDGSRFVDVTEGSGADVPGHGFGCATGDYDNDGDVDVYVVRLGTNVLLRNNGNGTFTDVSDEAGVADEGFGSSTAFLDYDRDGFLDLYVVNYVVWTPARERACYAPTGRRDYCSPRDYEAPAQDRLYRNNGRGGFEDVTQQAGILGERGNGLGILCTDFDNDGWVDIYVANDRTPAMLWMNQRDGTFVNEASLAGCAFNGDGLAIAGMGVIAEDFDDDKHFDLMVMNIYDESHLGLRNEGGFFSDATHAWGMSRWGVTYTGFGIGAFDQDNDGTLEYFIANGAVTLLPEPYRENHDYAEPNQFIRRNAEGRFYDASEAVGPGIRDLEMSRGVILGDYDNDGDVDVLITNNRGPAQLLRNENESNNAWLTLDLRPANGRRSAFNARVEVNTGGRTLLREVRPQVGYLTSNDPRLHFGLGAADTIESVIVNWADGSQETWEGLPINRFVTLRQGASPDVESNMAARDNQN